MRFTSENINELKENEIFVFGSNTSGIHIEGAAEIALKRWGARWGIGEGKQGNTYTIPTVNGNVIASLNLSKIKKYIDKFIEYAKNDKPNIYYVTKIGCGLAGYKIEDIAPLFKKAKNIENIYLSREFYDENNF